MQLNRVIRLVLLGFLVAATITPAEPAAGADNPIVLENQQAGSTGWFAGSLIADDAVGQIKAFASATSVRQGDAITLYITVNPAQTYSVDIWRIGWYGGSGGRLRQHVGPRDGTQQPPCDSDPTTGLIVCNWAPSYTFTIPNDWTSGLYLALLTNSLGYQNYAMFVVRDDRPADFLYQQSTTTDQAYNNYPADGRTGKSLYGYNSFGPNTVAGDARAVKVSFDRPYTGYGFNQWDTINFIRWIERSGYDVTYSTDLDTHANGAALRNHKGLLTGWGQYWSKEMFDAAESARDAGVNFAFFAADAISWQVRFEPAAGGAANRVMVLYRDASIDPVQGPTTTVAWRSPPVNRPEQTLRGIQFSAGVQGYTNVGYVVINSSHWVYAGTGFNDGDVVPGIVGPEVDRFMPGFPPPNATSRTLLSDSPFTNDGGAADRAQSSIYQAPSGAWVFSSGTLSWAWGLDDFNHNRADARIQRATANILDRFIFVAAPSVQRLDLTAPATVASGQAFVVTVTARDSLGNPVTNYGGRVHFSSSDTSAGVVLPADSTLTNGQGTFSITLTRSGPQTITVSDPAASLSTTVPVTVNAQPASGFALATAATPTAGTPFTFTVTAQDAFGNTDASYAGQVHFASGDTSAGVVLPADSTLTNGQGTFSATLVTPGPQTITATDTVSASISGTLSVTVRAAGATRLVVTTTTTPTAGAAFSFVVTAQDDLGRTDPAYAGRVRFSSSDTSTGVVLPPESTLTNGQGTFSATLIRAGSQTITAIDTTTASITGTLNVNVRAASARRLALAGTASTVAGTAFPLTITAQDQFGNTDAAYLGRIRFSSSDTSTGVVLPPESTLTNGTGTFSATLIRAGSQTITAVDTVAASITGTLTVTVRPAAAAELVLDAPGAAIIGRPFTVKVTLKDRFGNLATGYQGTVHFSTSDPLPVAALPANYTFTAADSGSRSFSVTLWTPPGQTVTVTDTVNGTLRASRSITLNLPPLL